MNLLSHWNLRELPCEATWDTRFIYAGPAHDEALNRLVYLVRETIMNIGLLSGEIGRGNALTRAVFTRRIDPTRFLVVTIENQGFPLEELLAAILRRLEPGTDLTGVGKLARCEILESAARKVISQGRHLVLLLDDAKDNRSSRLCSSASRSCAASWFRTQRSTNASVCVFISSRWPSEAL